MHIDTLKLAWVENGTDYVLSKAKPIAERNEQHIVCLLHLHELNLPCSDPLIECPSSFTLPVT